MEKKQKIIIIGAGPAGLTAAYDLMKYPERFEVTVLEQSGCFGGISRTVSYKGNRMDMGGHRFFSKVPEVNRRWHELMPEQGAPAKDDILLGREVPLKEGGPDPEREDRVMLRRGRVSRIYFGGKFYDYPVSLKWETLKNMGFLTTLEVGFGYLFSRIKKRPETNLENFYINRFGKKLYSMFFERYTENLWGRHPRDISAEWGAQRVKGLSIAAVLSDMLGKVFKKKDRRVETSLIESFEYPKLGPGQMWDICAEEIRKRGGRILKNARVIRLGRSAEGAVDSVVYTDGTNEFSLSADAVISSMPLKDLVAGMENVPEAPARIAAGLPYRDYITVGVLVPRLKLRNTTNRKTVSGIVPDEWVYVHDKSVKMGRFQIFNNWSPYLVKDLEHTVWVGLEYFCNEGDELWSMTDEAFAGMAAEETVKIGLIESTATILDTHVERVPKAYPAYFDTYGEIGTLRAFLDSVPNLYCVGRNGQHRYNNIDHSMLTAMEAAACLISGNSDRARLWNVNTEQEYHEEKKRG